MENEFRILEGEHPQVLIVEDDPVASLLLQRFFTSLQIPHDTARTGDQALQLHQKHPYRLVISNWMMPGMSGIELCHRFREQAGLYVYFILCTGRGQKEDRMEAFRSGVDDMLLKPVDPEELQARIQVGCRILGVQDNLQKQKKSLEDLSNKLQTTNATLRLASQRFEGLFNGMPVACFTLDRHGCVHEWNVAAEKLFQLQAHEVLQFPIWDLLNTLPEPFWSDRLVASVFDGEGVTEAEWSFVTRDGRTLHLLCNVFPLRNTNGEIFGAICANLNLTDRKNAERRIADQMAQINDYASELSHKRDELESANTMLRQLAVTDVLTGLWNRRRFQDDLDLAFEQYERDGRPFSLIMLDIDHFKAYNDRFGHQAGDQLLRQFADLLREETRQHESISRYGGEEFAILLSDCPLDQALAAAERFRRRIETAPWLHRNITASLGVSTLPTSASSVKELIEQADTALYASKGAGRNRICHFALLKGDPQKPEAA